MPAAITEVDESGAAGAPMGALIDEASMDAERPVRQTDHPFGAFCDHVREALKLPSSQSTREVVSAVVGHVARLTIIEKDEIEAQAAHIAKLVAKDREMQGDPQLWADAAKKIAEHVLGLRAEGNAPVAAEAREAA